MSLHDTVTEDAKKVFANPQDFAESIVYYKRNGRSRKINAVVVRDDSLQLPEASDLVTPRFMVYVSNDGSEGIESKELDLGGDQGKDERRRVPEQRGPRERNGGRQGSNRGWHRTSWLPTMTPARRTECMTTLNGREPATSGRDARLLVSAGRPGSACRAASDMARTLTAEPRSRGVGETPMTASASTGGQQSTRVTASPMSLLTPLGPKSTSSAPPSRERMTTSAPKTGCCTR